MPSINFKAEFAPAVERGEKRQTIRPKRKHPIKVGDTLYLYTGMRTKACRRLRVERCKAVRDVVIDVAGVELGGNRLRAASCFDFVRRDGFLSWAEFRDFFKSQYGLPFKGDLIEWEGN